MLILWHLLSTHSPAATNDEKEIDRLIRAIDPDVYSVEGYRMIPFEQKKIWARLHQTMGTRSLLPLRKRFGVERHHVTRWSREVAEKQRGEEHLAVLLRQLRIPPLVPGRERTISRRQKKIITAIIGILSLRRDGSVERFLTEYGLHINMTPWRQDIAEGIYEDEVLELRELRKNLNLSCRKKGVALPYEQAYIVVRMAEILNRRKRGAAGLFYEHHGLKDSYVAGLRRRVQRGEEFREHMEVTALETQLSLHDRKSRQGIAREQKCVILRMVDILSRWKDGSVAQFLHKHRLAESSITRFRSQLGEEAATLISGDPIGELAYPLKDAFRTLLASGAAAKGDPSVFQAARDVLVDDPIMTAAVCGYTPMGRNKIPLEIFHQRKRLGLPLFHPHDAATGAQLSEGMLRLEGSKDEESSSLLSILRYNSEASGDEAPLVAGTSVPERPWRA